MNTKIRPSIWTNPITMTCCPIPLRVRVRALVNPNLLISLWLEHTSRTNKELQFRYIRDRRLGKLLIRLWDDGNWRQRCALFSYIILSITSNIQSIHPLVIHLSVFFYRQPIEWDRDIAQLEGQEILVEIRERFPNQTSISHNFVIICLTFLS